MPVCELCAHRSRRRLCGACAEMIVRLNRIWLSLDSLSRCRLQPFATELEKQPALAAAAASSGATATPSVVSS